MTLPDWRTATKGSRVRAALWLHSEVGAGSSFTKQQLREAFPNIEQIDRRVRDLRAEGWIIATYREDRTLGSADELRLVHEGGQVWEQGYESRQPKAISDKVRQTVFAADDYMCVYCGIGGGESYTDNTLRTAKLTVARTEALGDGKKQLVTCCDRCHVGHPEQETVEHMLSDLESLSPDAERRLVAWVRNGKRALPPENALWARYRRLPSEARQAVKDRLDGHY